MSITTKCMEAAMLLYRSTNRVGLLDSRFVRSLYTSAYFTYKKYLEDSYAKLSKHHSEFFKGGNILDIGANIGYTSFIFSKVIDDGFKIIAFEPEEKNLEFLKQVSCKYNFSDQLVSVATAVGDTNGHIDLWKNEAHNGDHRILTDELKKRLNDNVTVQKTPIITIDHYLEKYGGLFTFSFIKIDVQGYELAVCRGMDETLTCNPNVIISFEYCPSITETLGFRSEELLQFFQNRGYQFYFLNRKNKIEKYNIARGDLLLREMRKNDLKARHYDYIELLCSRRNLIK